MNKRVLVFSGVAACAGALVYARLRVEPQPHKSAVVVSEQQVAEAAIAAPPYRVEPTLPVRPAALAAATAEARRAAPQVSPRREVTSEVWVRAFDEDRPADRKASYTQAALVDVFRARPRGASLSSVECRATQCRLQLQFPNADAGNQMLSEFWSLLEKDGVDVNGLSFVVPTRSVGADQRVDATMYLTHVPTQLAARTPTPPHNDPELAEPL